MKTSGPPAESINKTPVAHYYFNSLIKETSKKENWGTCARHGVNVQIGVWLGNGEGLIWKKVFETKKFSSKKFFLHMKTNCFSDGNVNKTPSLMTLTKFVEDLMFFD